MKKLILVTSINREMYFDKFDITPKYNAFVDAAYTAKGRLLEASENDEELYELISETSFNKTFSLSHAKHIDEQSERLSIKIDYEKLIICVRYTNDTVQLDITNLVINK